MSDRYTRREFVGTIAQAAGAVAVATTVAAQAYTTDRSLPQRRLGRTGAQVSVLGLGMGPLGIADYSAAETHTVVRAALDEWGGPVYVDVQPDYGEAERYLAPVIRERREDVFIVTKTWEQNRAGALASVQESVRRLEVEYVDAVLLNNIGFFDLEQLFTRDGALAGLRDAQAAGLVRYVGLSGHMGRDRFVAALDSGEFDIAMPAINFVDRHTYDFEGIILPLAATHDVGVAAMKVLGGAVDWDYSTRAQRALLLGDDYEPAIRYALGLPEVATAVIGCKSVDEVRHAANAARGYRPLSEDEQDRLLERGKQLAAQWGPHFGPVEVATQG